MKNPGIFPGFFQCLGSTRALSLPGSGLRDVRGLGTFLTLNYFELHLVTFGELLESPAGDCADVDVHVGAALSRHETDALRIVEPHHSAGNAYHNSVLSPAGDLTVLTDYSGEKPVSRAPVAQTAIVRNAK